MNALNGACADIGAGQRVSHSTYQKLTQKSELVTSNVVKSLASCAIPVVGRICRMWWCWGCLMAEFGGRSWTVERVIVGLLAPGSVF